MSKPSHFKALLAMETEARALLDSARNLDAQVSRLNSPDYRPLGDALGDVIADLQGAVRSIGEARYAEKRARRGLAA